jgi:triosephosphate isomerase
VIVGHSERRGIFKESDEMIGKRLVKVTESGLIGILCVGEKEEEREEGKTEEVLERQMEIALNGVYNVSLIVAYEPVWAIGTGRRAEIKDIEASHRFIRKKLFGKFGKDAEKIRVIYGGSVKPDNIAELVSSEEVDGALIGGASLSVDSFAEIVTRAIERRIA